MDKQYSYALNSPPDSRDYLVGVPIVRYTPSYASLTKKFSPDIGNQSHYNACTGFGSAGMLRVYFDSTIGVKLNVSPWWIWWHGRVRSGFKGTPNGVYIRELFKVFQKDGVILQNTWKPKNPVKEEPPNYPDKYRLKIDRYRRLNFSTIGNLQNVIIHYIDTLKLPIGISIKITDEFDQTAKTGVYKYNRNGRLRGSHWVYIEGFSNHGENVSIVNSYGLRWGNRGLFTMSITDLFECINEGWMIDQFCLSNLEHKNII